MEYFKRRRSALKADEAELNRLFKYIADAFGEEWLGKKPDHPLRKLWQRNDELSTNELYTLACGLERFQGDRKWLQEKLKDIKATDRNNRQGALFEIIGLNMLSGPQHYVTPARLTQAGYDGIMQVAESKEIRFSLKNYGISIHQERFEKKAAEVETLVTRLLKKYKINAVNIFVDCLQQYPEKDEWNLLTANLEPICRQFASSKSPYYVIGEDKVWSVVFYPLSGDLDHYHQGFTSYSFILTAPLHRNESQNLLSSIHSACDNLVKHSSVEDDHIRNFLFIRLPPNCSPEKSLEWVQEYFSEFTEKPISAVIFYQPNVASIANPGANSAVTHYFMFYVRPEKITGWWPEGLDIRFNIPVGIVINEAAKRVLRIEQADGVFQQVDFFDRYVYQHGNHYKKMIIGPDGTMSGNIYQLGSGIFVNSVVEIPGQPGNAAISGRFPPFDELLIL